MPEDKNFPQHATLLFVPSGGQKVRKIVLPHPIPKILPFFLVIFVVLFILNITLLLYYHRGSVAYERSRKDHDQMTLAMHEATMDLQEMERSLERISAFDSKLRMLAQLQDPDRQLRWGPLNTESPQRNADETVDSPFDDIVSTVAAQHTVSDPAELLFKTKRLQSQTADRELSLVSLIDQFKQKEQILASTPAIWPTNGALTSRFGMRISPFTRNRKFHAGIDIGAQPGTPVYAPADGRVVFVGSKSGYGETLIIDHGWDIITCFAHNSKVNVRLNQSVKRGQLVARVGNTGQSTGPHLHYEVRLHGVPQNPSLFILN